MNAKVERHHQRLKHLRGWDWTFGVLHCSDTEIHEVLDKVEAEYKDLLQQKDAVISKLREQIGDMLK